MIAPQEVPVLAVLETLGIPFERYEHPPLASAAVNLTIPIVNRMTATPYCAMRAPSREAVAAFGLSTGRESEAFALLGVTFAARESTCVRVVWWDLMSVRDVE